MIYALATGLARKVVTSWAGDSYYTPGPNLIYQRAWANGIPFEHWSIRTVPRARNANADALVNAALDGAPRAPA